MLMTSSYGSAEQFNEFMLRALPNSFREMPEAKMCVGILVITFKDLNSNSKAARRSALWYVTSDISRFDWWCEMLGTEPEYVRRVMLKHNEFLAKNFGRVAAWPDAMKVLHALEMEEEAARLRKRGELINETANN